MSWDQAALGQLEPLFGANGKDEIVIGFDTLDELSHGLGMLYEISLRRQTAPEHRKAKERAVRNATRVLSANWGDPHYLPLSEEARAELEEFICPNPDGLRSPTDPKALDDWEDYILIQAFQLLLDNPEVRYREPKKKTWKLKAITKDAVCKLLTRAIAALCNGIKYDEKITLSPGFRYTTRKDFDRRAENGGEEGKGLRVRMERAFPEAFKRLEGWSKQEAEGRPRHRVPYRRSSGKKAG